MLGPLTYRLLQLAVQGTLTAALKPVSIFGSGYKLVLYTAKSTRSYMFTRKIEALDRYRAGPL